MHFTPVMSSRCTSSVRVSASEEEIMLEYRGSKLLSVYTEDNKINKFMIENVVGFVFYIESSELYE